MKELFATDNNVTVTTNARQLSGTAELTRIAEKVARDIINSMEADIENYRDKLTTSSSDPNVMDDIIDEFFNAEAIDTEFLKTLDEKTIDGMLKSQQSKRSRCKAKTMTLDNYYSMLTAAVAENIIRVACNKPKLSRGAHRKASLVDYTPAQLEALSADQDTLRKEIRNIQSKKSIMKSKADFDESSEAWIQLLKAEAMLKDLRVGGRGTHLIEVEVDTTKNAVAELLNGVDIEHLKAAEAKELLAAIKQLIEQ